MDEQHLAGIMADYRKVKERADQLEIVAAKAQIFVNATVIDNVPRAISEFQELAKALNQAGLWVAK